MIDRGWKSRHNRDIQPCGGTLMVKSVKLIGAAAVLSCGALLVGGCDANRTTAGDVRRDWSPELHSLTQHKEMHRTMRARTVDTNMRMVQDDLDKLLMLDSPSGLSRWSVP